MRTDRVLGGAVALIVALATTSGVVASRREASSVTAGGPVAAVQAYLRAVVDPTATVQVDLRFGGGALDPFGPPDGGRQFFELRTVGGAWRLTGMPWPLVNLLVPLAVAIVVLVVAVLGGRRALSHDAPRITEGS
ncbi:MAG: hypothetical protein HOQ27_10120, partial [Dermatophilaceae bacterium]|nr:hypothetical protein [Dermatophilaceae bacterium]